MAPENELLFGGTNARLGNMMICLRRPLCLCLVIAAASVNRSLEAQQPLVFTDVSSQWGLAKPLQGVMSHAMACGDIDDDGDLDVYIGTFCDRPAKEYLGREGPVPNLLLLNQGDRFVLGAQQLQPIAKRTSGAVFTDFDNDGDLDLYVSNNSTRAEEFRGINRLYENIAGKLEDVSVDNKACIVMGGRGLGVLDYDGDGLLDLLVLEDYWHGGQSRLFRNLSNLQFQDVTEASGLKIVTDERRGIGLRGLGVVASDWNQDGWPDLFISDPNLMLLNDRRGHFRPVDSTALASPLDTRTGQYVAGVACRDLDNDGDLDLVTVDHTAGSAMHVYMNLGLTLGVPRFIEVTKQAGLDYTFASNSAEGLYLRHDHVEISDFDNDGRRDIFVAASYLDNGQRKPFVCRNLGGHDEAIRFSHPPHEHADAHYPAGAVADYDRDGRMDLFLASWFPSIPSSLLLNRTTSVGHWLQVEVEGKTINRMGIGAKVLLYESGKLGDRTALLGYDEVCITQGFCTGHEAVCHFGLGDALACDVEVRLPFGQGRIVRRNVKADRRLVMKQP